MTNDERINLLEIKVDGLMRWSGAPAKFFVGRTANRELDEAIAQLDAAHAAMRQALIDEDPITVIRMALENAGAGE